MSLLTLGNTAKLYCLNWIELFIEKNPDAKILDLGCGTGLNFVKLLQMNPDVHYTGIEPDKNSFVQAKKNLMEFNSHLINSDAYYVDESLNHSFDIVVSFSVLEHVYKRLNYLNTAKICLKPDGYFLINYDSGHFFTSNKFKDGRIVYKIFAFMGNERSYQSFVKEKTFIEIIKDLGFNIIDSKFFNMNKFKHVYKIMSESHIDEYMKRWLEFELWLNETGIEYDDSKAEIFGSRNFILSLK